ncbi:P-loop containing nucleoside triphosphate hydrolase protein [Scleroderma citrinum]
MSAIDPLTINLARLLTCLPQNAIPASASTREILDALSRMLARPAMTCTIADVFRPLLIDLCARWMNDEEDMEERFCALCLLIENNEHIFPVLSAFLRRPSFGQGPLSFVDSAPSISALDTTRLHRLLLAYYRLLRANRLIPADLGWPASMLSALFVSPKCHPDRAVKWLAIRCYAMHVGMAEAERVKLEKHVIGDEEGEYLMWYGERIDGTGVFIDATVLPTLELKRVYETRQAIVASPDYYTREDGDVTISLSDSDLSTWIVNIHGILMFKSSPAPPAPSSFIVPTPSAIHALRTLALHISLRLPTLITSPPSSGKSLFLAYLASILFPDTKDQIVTVHLGDTSLDPRSLLGSYVSSPTQLGTFEWKDGVLVRAMKEGKWLVLKDVDKGSIEVLGLIKPLVESIGPGNWIGARASVDVPNRGKVYATEQFRLFAMRSVGVSSGAGNSTGKISEATFYGAHKFHEVVVDMLSLEEVEEIIGAKFMRLGGTQGIRAMVRLWTNVQKVGVAMGGGLRDLEKFCRRVEGVIGAYRPSMDVDMDADADVSFSSLFPNSMIREEMYLQARDVFFGAGALTAPAQAQQTRIAALIASHLGLDADRQEWILYRRTPLFELEKDDNGDIVAVHIGRTRLPACPRKSKLPSSVTGGRQFAMHKPAICLLSRIAIALSLSEPILLTGETGTGKTSLITHLSYLLNHRLVSLNLSHQTESSDLLGGFKPVDARMPAAQLYSRFIKLFGETFSRKRNVKYEESVRKGVEEGKWRRVVLLWRECVRLAKERMAAKDSQETVGEPEGPRKRRRVEDASLGDEWAQFEKDLDEFDIQHAQGQGKFAFDFVEGPLVRALRFGDWVLLDEINLASAETLECITSLLSGSTASITLTEKGSLEPIPRHPDFRLFACMNPATDTGKKDLPPNIRLRFTEIDVPPPDADRETLLSIVAQYIGDIAVGDKAAIMDVAEFYTAVRTLADERRLADGSDHRPHYSMRTLARALMFAADVAPVYGLRRALWEGCLMAFTMVLDGPSASTVTALAQKHILAGVRNPRSLLSMVPAPPPSRPADDFVKFGPFYLERGPLVVDPMEDYIMTPSVEKKLIDLARIALTRRFPVLIEGPTSSGKTSAVEYLARRTGHQFIRINNHEHTDIQEYIGSYVSDPLTGKLVFKDGLLVNALRCGHWIVLDELNLAPTEVLEALNRLLDDNRELLIPETHEVVRPHSHFMLFATQNPPGMYAGRKVLSRAFRNRFLEAHFQDVPQAELEAILCQRCRIAPSYGQRIVSVFRELQKRRQSGRVFESKQGFATLRDLFRWAGRDAVGYQELAENGYMLLAERARREEDRLVVKDVIESVMKVRIDEKALYDLRQSSEFEAYIGCGVPSSSQVVWTYAMRRLFVLVARALRFNEPVLLVGETGSGKTSVCQLYADVSDKSLHTLSCHQNTETADVIGGLRPVRNRSSTVDAAVFQDSVALLNRAGIVNVPADVHGLITQINELMKANIDPSLQASLRELRSTLVRSQALFEWHDGPLVRAMRQGAVFLLDEISLADDSVLERLNSVLEPARTVVLAERGSTDGEYPAIRAADTFKLLATMNPGGDYGKKELSPALRNRFTEIWVPPVDGAADLAMIVDSSWRHVELKSLTAPLLEFCSWLRKKTDDHTICSLRDMLAWVAFSNAVVAQQPDGAMQVSEIFHHAAHMTFLDGLGSLPQTAMLPPEDLRQLKDEAARKLNELVPYVDSVSSHAYNPLLHVQLGPFAIPKGPEVSTTHGFNLDAPTTRENVMRVVRACQLDKPILLEGSPGVGKTSLIAALAKIAGYHLCRINLSDQTDLIDLFGSDLPVENGAPGEFAWKDAEFLRAMQEGHWVLLDEMNLAPQTVLEGLNAILDHRGTVFIPELSRTFVRHPFFRVFAAQNPLHQGGGRKGLPKSFLDRFTKVYAEELSADDMFIICREQFKNYDENLLRGMIKFNTLLNRTVVQDRSLGREGSPWEFNLRDIIRWGELLRASAVADHPQYFLRTVYLSRFRTPEDRSQAEVVFSQVFPSTGIPDPSIHYPIISPTHLQIGHFSAPRGNAALSSRPTDVLQVHLTALETIWACLSRSWLVIVIGQRDSGKSCLIRTVADLSGNHLDEVGITSATDASDILGGFEQVDQVTRVFGVATQVLELSEEFMRSVLGVNHRYRHFGRLRRELASAVRTQTSVLQATAHLLAELTTMNLDDSNFNGPLKSLQSTVTELSRAGTSVGRFEWVDGPLIQAMKKGHWLVLDGANMCNASVLDRLNSLCEPNGVLTLSERGFVDGDVQVLKPHPNFRLFMTVDPQHGELSRAMRNRGLEVSLLTSFTMEDRSRILANNRLPETPEVSIYTTFEETRRGIVSRAQRAPMAMVSGSISDDIISKHLATLAPIVDAENTISIHAVVPFVTRVLPSPLFAVMRRYLQAISPTLDICSIFEDRYLSDTAMALACVLKEPTTGIAEELVDVLPLGDFMLCPPCSRCTEKSERQQGYVLRLQILDLFAALVLDKFEKSKHCGLANRPPRRLPEAITEGIQSVVVEIDTAAQNLFGGFQSRTSNFRPDDFNISVKLLAFSRQLQRMLARDSFDYSAAQVLTKLISTAVESCSPIYGHVAAASNALNGAISPSSGLGLIPIWSRLHNSRAVEFGPSFISCLEHDLQHPRLDGQKSLLQRFQMLALATLPTNCNSKRSAEITTISSQIRELSGRTQTADTSLGKCFSNPISLLVELQAICKAQGPEANASVTFSRVIQVALEALSEDLRRFVPYQQVIWVQDSADEIPASVVARMHTLWLESLWRQEPGKQGILDGPNIMFHPTQLYVAFEKCLTDVPLLSLDEHEASVQRHLCLAIRQCYTQQSRFQQLMAMFNQCLDMLASCFSTFLDNGHIQHSKNGELLEDTKVLLNALSCSTFEPLRKAMLHLTPALHFYGNVGAADLGRCWVALSRVVLDLLVPDIPMDPAAILRCSTELLQEEAQLLADQITLHTRLEERTSGNKTNAVISYLEARVQENKTSQEPLSGIPSRNSIANLTAFWSEVFQFMKQIIHYPKIDDLTLALVSSDASAFKREDVIQESISGFTQRLVNLYPEFDDIVHILRLAFSQLKLGLRLVRHASEHPSLDGNDNAYATSLIAFPPIRSATLIQSQASVGRGISVGEHLLLVIAAAAYCNHLSGLSKLARVVQTAYEQIYRLWTIDRARDEKREQEFGSLYRSRAVYHDARSEAELEETEFLELFPTFEDTLPHSEPGDAGNDARNDSHHLSPSQHRQLLALHLELTGLNDTDPHFATLRHALLRSYLGSHVLSLPASLDKDALPEQIGLLQSRLTLLRDSTIVTRSGDFYTDANVSEARKALTIVRSLRSRLVTLLQEWPDQMVIQHLLSRCDLILAFDINSPVAKLLSALEQLLLQTEDWEMYANRDNTLKDHRFAITNLIVEWRRLELACWSSLLESQSCIFTEAAAEYWFHLYELLIRGPLTAAEEAVSDGPSRLSQYLQQLPSLLDAFIRTSSLGQFQVRLDLLKSFETLISRVIFETDDEQSAILSRVRHIVHLSWRSYHLFAPDLSTCLGDQRRSLEKEIGAFIKLASWRDINVQALKQSARKTHHQLYKIIRKFRDVLRQPVVDKLAPLFSAETTEGAQQAEQPIFSRRYALPSCAFLPDPVFSTSPLPAHLGNLAKTFEMFHGYIDTRVREFLVRNAARDVQQLSLSIVLTAKDLTSQAIPGKLSKEKREKYKKSLLTRKRKVWSDLQKELKRGGLTYHIKPDISNQLRDESWIRGQPLLHPEEDIITTERGEIYFDRLRGCLPVLRDVLVSHHSDLGTSDLSRGVSLVESGYYLALETRSTLSRALSHHATLLRQIGRLQEIAQASVLVCTKSSDQLELLRHNLSISARALDELAEGIRLFSHTQDGCDVTGLVPKCLDLGESLRTAQGRITEIFEKSQPVMPHILLEEEHATIIEASHIVQSLPTRLDEMAKAFPQLNYLLGPTSQWIRDQGVFSFSQVNPSSTQPVSDMDSVIDTLLVAVQNMLRQCPEPSDKIASLVANTEGPPDKYIRAGARTTSLFTSLLDLPGVTERVFNVTTTLAQLSHDLVQAILRRILPFLQLFGALSRELLKSQATWTAELFKLDYVLCSVVHTLATRGFCIPPETEEGEGTTGNERGRELEGTGIGEGAGIENVSKEIEDESQVEGLQGDEAEEMERGEDKDDENTIEMSEEFGGELEDVPEGDEDEDSEQDGEGPEDQLADLDKSDPNVVDEKLWGDEAGEREDQKQNGELHEDHSEHTKGESEMAANEGKKDKKSTRKEEETRKEESKQADGSDQTGDEVMEEDVQEEDQPYPNEAGAPMDEHIPDANTLDLPEDMNLDDKEQQDKGNLDMNDAISENEDLGPDDQTDEDEARQDVDTMDNASIADDDTSQDGQPPHVTKERTPDETGMAEDKTEEGAVAKPDLTSGDGDPNTEENTSRPQDSAKDGQKGTASSQVQESICGEERTAESEQKPTDPSTSKSEPQPPAEPTSQKEANPGAGSEGAQSGPAHPQQSHALPLVPDPLRKLGDALNEIQQRFDEIFGPPEQTHPPEDAPEPDDIQQVMYELDELDDSMQALGPAAEEQVAKLRELTLVEKNQDNLETTDINPNVPRHTEEAREIAMEHLRAEQTSERIHTDLEGAIALTERNKEDARAGSPSSLGPTTPKASDESEPKPEDPSISDESIRAVLESLSSDPGTIDLSAYMHLWTLYTSLTMPLSIALCESLRLILAPTLATRLRGDFRTGKRLNMRRVIAWVASEYTKDRIWLRRVKPSARSYQVLLAVDDSASMRGSGGGAVHLAYQTVVLVAQALGRLEAGEVGVARFGAGWELVRGFGEGARDWGSSPAAGGRVLSSLTFRQQRTDVAGFLEGSLSVLEAARDTAGIRGATKDLWQLEIIISDGICQEHERLRRALRRARSMRVLVVFIVLDALNNSAASGASGGSANASSAVAAGTSSSSSTAQSSILTLNQVSYRQSPTTGQMELMMERYLDSFPFEYYVVLRDVEALPRVLADTLREFFERVSEE